jgi:uncharacterized protein with HEPN domain
MSKRSSQLLLEDIVECAKKILAYTEELSFEQFVADRNRIVHDYMGIDYKIVWLVKEGFLPDLISKITNILPK